MSGPYETLSEIGELMRHLPGEAWNEQLRLPWWLTQAARKASLFLIGQSIAFVTGSTYKPPTYDTTSKGEPISSVPGRFVVFGDRHVVVSDIVEGQQPNEVRTSTQLVARAALTDIHPVDVPISLEPKGRYWPYEQDLVLTYEVSPTR